jgi:hypothetical protein
VNRLEELLDEPRPGALRSITDKQVEAVVTKTLESMPESSTHWSSRLMAKKTGLSQTVRREGAGHCWVVYESAGSWDRGIVLCVDEKSQV